MKKELKKSLTGLMVLFFLLTFTTTSWAQTGFTQKDRDLLIQLYTKVDEMEKRFDQRFEQVDQRFEQVDQRFGDMMTFKNLIPVLKEYAAKNKKFADIIKQYNIFKI